MRTLDEVFESGVKMRSRSLHRDLIQLEEESLRAYTKPQLAAIRAEVARECYRRARYLANQSLAITSIESLAKQLENEV